MKVFRGRRACGGYILACLLLAGCASEIQREPTQFIPVSQSGEPLMVFTQAIDVYPSNGYIRTFKKGSAWKLVGRIPQGRVYAIQDDVFMLEGKHMREAYCVIGKDALLVGFYLPVEQAFVAISPPAKLPVNLK